MELKLDKKEKDFNRLNLNYAKMINKSKKQENINNEELVQKLEKARDENKKLRNTITKYKSEQQFIGISFIADDLEGEQFIDDKCFEEILNGLEENKNNNNEIKYENIFGNRYENKSGNKQESKNTINDTTKYNKEINLKDKINNINFGNNNFYFESKINYEKSCMNTMNTINTNNTINNPSRHIGARGFYKSKRKNG